MVLAVVANGRLQHGNSAPQSINRLDRTQSKPRHGRTGIRGNFFSIAKNDAR